MPHTSSQTRGGARPGQANVKTLKEAPCPQNLGRRVAELEPDEGHIGSINNMCTRAASGRTCKAMPYKKCPKYS